MGVGAGQGAEWWWEEMVARKRRAAPLAPAEAPTPR